MYQPNMFSFFFGGKNFDGDTAKWWYNGICMDAVCFGDII